MCKKLQQIVASLKMSQEEIKICPMTGPPVLHSSWERGGRNNRGLAIPGGLANRHSSLAGQRMAQGQTAKRGRETSVHVYHIHSTACPEAGPKWKHCIIFCCSRKRCERVLSKNAAYLTTNPWLQQDDMTSWPPTPDHSKMIWLADHQPLTTTRW